MSLQSYKDRVESYIRKNKNHLTIHKLSHNIPITQTELDVLEKILFTERCGWNKRTVCSAVWRKAIRQLLLEVLRG